MSCPDLLVLSQLADGELPEGEAGSLAAHVAGCAHCAPRLERARRALRELSDAAAPGAAPEEASRAPDCPTPSALAAFCADVLRGEERAALTRHFEACDACVADALAAVRLVARLDAGPRLPVPEALQARVAAAWPESAPTPRLSEIVVRVTRAAAQLVESRLLEPLRELVELPMALPATRAASEAKALCFRLQGSSALITATLVPAGDGVGLTLAIEDDAGGMLADQRVFFRRHGRSIYSARTDQTGSLRVPSLERGVYEVSCPGVGTTFRLDLRP